jgi:Ca2+-binding EF-hand superfamily protein
MFKMEEVVLEVGEQSDDLANQALLKKREFTGRQRLARYSNMFARKGVTRVAAHDLFTERLLSKRKQAFRQLDKDGDGYLTREELQAQKDWLEALELVRGEWGSVEWSALQGQGIQKEDIDKLLEKEADLNGDGRISFDEFVHVRAGEPEFMPGEAVRVMGSSVINPLDPHAGPSGPGRSTAAVVVRRVGPDVDYYYVRTFSFRAWQPSWVLASVLVYGMMAPAMVLSAAQQLVVLLKNGVRRGKKLDFDAPELGYYPTDEDYKGSMVFMGKEEKARHALCKTKCLWLWQYVPFATPQQKFPAVRDYGYVTASTVAQFVRSNPGVKTLYLDGCPNVGTEALAVVGTSCKALKKLSLMFCELTGTSIH